MAFTFKGKVPDAKSKAKYVYKNAHLIFVSHPINIVKCYLGRISIKIYPALIPDTIQPIVR